MKYFLKSKLKAFNPTFVTSATATSVFEVAFLHNSSINKMGLTVDLQQLVMRDTIINGEGGVIKRIYNYIEGARENPIRVSMI